MDVATTTTATTTGGDPSPQAEAEAEAEAEALRGEVQDLSAQLRRALLNAQTAQAAERVRAISGRIRPPHASPPCPPAMTYL